MQVNNVIARQPAIFQDPDFRWALIHHLDLLKSSAAYTRPPDALTQEKYRGDFRFVLLDIGIPKYMHWLIARLNGINDMQNWELLTDGMYLIDENNPVLTSLITLYRTNNGKK